MTRDWVLYIRRAQSLLFALLFGISSYAQQNWVFATDDIRSLRLIVDEDPLLPPVILLNGRQQLELSFDYMSHEPQRLVYHIFHCDYRWRHDGGESLFESDYLTGNNGQPIEQYETSFNTTQNYTHYSLVLPGEDVRWLLSGNYCIEVFREDDYEGENSTAPLLRAEFCVVELGMHVSARVSANTDIDFNRAHQQVSYDVGFGSLRVVNPERELHTVVMQNRRSDNAVVDLQPNLRNATGIGYSHRRELIFPATNEFHKFETIDMHRPTLNVDHLRWHAPYYHATLYPTRREHNYTYDEDADGGSLLRNAEYGDQHITSEYLWVHFTFRSGKPLPGQPPYVCGQWTNGAFDPACRMEYAPQAGEYRAAVLLKQGYYDYQLRQPDADGKGSTLLTDGDFYETENEYTIYVYYRAQGERYDRLVGYGRINSKI